MLALQFFLKLMKTQFLRFRMPEQNSNNNEENGEGGGNPGPEPGANLQAQVQNITLAALREMQFDSPPGSALSAPVSSPLHTPVCRAIYRHVCMYCMSF